MRLLAVGCWLLAVGCLLSSCSKAGETLSSFFGSTTSSEYSTWPCSFYYENLQNAEALQPALAIHSGVFCKISERVRAGKKYFYFENSSGLSTEVPQYDTYRKNIIGLNNGIIVGYQTLVTEPYGGFIGYDVQCPNCVRRENNTINPNYPVTIDSKGLATCTVCKKVYNMNNGGIIQNGEEGDTGLAKYAAVTDGINISVFRKQ